MLLRKSKELTKYGFTLLMEFEESPETHMYSQLIFQEDTSAIQWEEESVFNKRCWITGCLYEKKK